MFALFCLWWYTCQQFVVEAVQLVLGTLPTFVCFLSVIQNIQFHAAIIQATIKGIGYCDKEGSCHSDTDLYCSYSLHYSLMSAGVKFAI